MISKISRYLNRIAFSIYPSKYRLQEIINYCSSKEEAKPGFPFGDSAMVFKVNNKMFALIGLNEPLSINLKCDPGYALILREKYDAVIPGYHMNKKHWNTVRIVESISNSLLFEWIDEKYC